jgi:hypothetical protein
MIQVDRQDLAIIQMVRSSSRGGSINNRCKTLLANPSSVCADQNLRDTGFRPTFGIPVGTAVETISEHAKTMDIVEARFIMVIDPLCASTAFGGYSYIALAEVMLPIAHREYRLLNVAVVGAFAAKTKTGGCGNHELPS